MAGKIIWYVTMFSTAAVFYGIGVYAQKLEKPMWFWAGTEVDAASIRDVKAYNRENARMWKLFSLWFWAAGAAQYWSGALALTLLVLSCTVGMAALVATFLKIEKKYKLP